MEDGQLFTWDTLATISGSSLAVFLLVQYTKSLVDRYLPMVPTNVYTVAVSFVVLVVTQLAKGSGVYDWRMYALTFFNAFIVASTASHIYEKSLNPPMLRSKEKPNPNSNTDMSVTTLKE